MTAFTRTLAPATLRVAAAIPALNEEASIAGVVRSLPVEITPIVVADNGSTDRTAEHARHAGATVVTAPRRGYGSACLAALEHLLSLDAPPDAVLFLDADAADDPSDIPALLEPIRTGDAELVIGSRALGNAEPGSLNIPQRFGNRLATTLLRTLFTNARYTDLGPFRAIRTDALRQLRMDDTNYGWTVQMQARAAAAGLSNTEVPVAYRRRIGTSKISGTVKGVTLAGTKIIATIARERLTRTAPTTRVSVLARLPTPGRTKTRLTPHLSPEKAASLQHELTRHTLQRVAAFRHTVHLATADDAPPDAALKEAARLYGRWRDYRPQAPGDLGERLAAATAASFDAGAEKSIAIGTDCPTLSHRDLADADAELDHHDAVLGPAADGGYHLIGLHRRVRHLAPRIFSDIEWGSETVARRTIQTFRMNSVRFTTLAERQDIDRPEDLPHWHRVKSTSDPARTT